MEKKIFAKNLYLCIEISKNKKKMEATVFNPIQLYLLQLFSHMSSEQELEELQKVLSDFYFNKVEQRAAEIYEEKGWTQETLEAMSNEHFRIHHQ